MRVTLGTAALTALVGLTSAAQAQEKLKIGLLLTLSGPSAVLGQQARDGFNLAVKDLGGKLGGREVDVLVVETPPEFGRDLIEGRRPEVGFFVEASAPFNGLNIRGYITGVVLKYVSALTRSPDAMLLRPEDAAAASLPISVAQRFAYNQDFKSIYAITPGTIMLTLILIPAMLTALGVVREKELGSITNLYVTPVTRLEFLLGKQLPYIGLAAFNLHRDPVEASEKMRAALAR